MFPSSGLTSRYSNWDKEEPGGGTIENCVGLQTKGRKWHDYLCTNKFSYACKKNPQSALCEDKLILKKNLAFSNSFFFLNWMQFFFCYRKNRCVILYAVIDLSWPLIWLYSFFFSLTLKNMELWHLFLK